MRPAAATGVRLGAAAGSSSPGAGAVGVLRGRRTAVRAHRHRPGVAGPGRQDRARGRVLRDPGRDVLAVMRRHVSYRVRYALVMLGSVLIACLLYAGHGGAATASYAGFYVFVAVYAFLFFAPRDATVQVLVAIGAEAEALQLVGGPVPAQLLLNGGIILATGAVVGVLAGVRPGAHGRADRPSEPPRHGRGASRPPASSWAGRRPARRRPRRLQGPQRRMGPRRGGPSAAAGRGALGPGAARRRCPRQGRWRRVHRPARCLRRRPRAAWLSGW